MRKNIDLGLGRVQSERALHTRLFRLFSDVRRDISTLTFLLAIIRRLTASQANIHAAVEIIQLNLRIIPTKRFLMKIWQDSRVNRRTILSTIFSSLE